PPRSAPLHRPILEDTRWVAVAPGFDTGPPRQSGRTRIGPSTSRLRNHGRGREELVVWHSTEQDGDAPIPPISDGSARLVESQVDPSMTHKPPKELVREEAGGGHPDSVRHCNDARNTSMGDERRPKRQECVRAATLPALARREKAKPWGFIDLG